MSMTAIDQPEMFTEFEEIEKLKLDQMTLKAEIDAKNRKIESLTERVNQKLAAMDGIVTSDDALRMVHNFNYYWENLHGIEHCEGELIDLKEFPNLFSWLMAFNIVKCSCPDAISYDYGQDFIASLFLAFNSTPGTYGELRSLAHAGANVVYIGSENFKIPGAVR